MSQRSEKNYLSVCAIYKNEARYLQEWLEFHRLVGVERFYLYDNGSTDAHLDVIGPYVDEGVVVLREWPLPHGQHAAYDDCLREHWTESRWIAFFDVDEFLFSPTRKALPDVVRAYERHPGLVVNVIPFGTSGHRDPPEGLVIENYTQRIRHPPRTVKSIVDPRRATRCWGAHHFRYLQATYRVGDVGLDRMVYLDVYPVDENQHVVDPDHTRDFTSSILRLNHYFTKSENEYRAKWAKARADTGRLRAPLTKAHLDSLSEVRDESIKTYVPAAREAMDNRARLRA